MSPSRITKPARLGRNDADLGVARVDEYSALEEGVQNVEDIDAGVSNAGAVASGVSRATQMVAKVAPTVARITPALNTVRVVGSRVAPVQAALWGIDAGRAVVDPEYRKETLDATNSLYDDASKSTLRKSVETGLNTLARPVSSVGAMARSYSDSSRRIEEAEKAGEAADARYKILFGKREQKEADQEQERRKLEDQRKAKEVMDYIQRMAEEGRKEKVKGANPSIPA
jgi:hypothetical protein